MPSTLAVPIAPHLLALAMLVEFSCPSMAWAVPAETSSDPAATFGALTTEAKTHRESEAYAESARSFAAAYEVLNEKDRAGIRGEIAVNNAIDDFRKAQERAPEDISLLEDEVALLNDYEGNPNREGEMPPGLLSEFERARTEVDLARAKVRAEELRRQHELEADAEPSAPTEPPTATGTTEDVGELRRRKTITVAGITMMTLGALGVVGGVPMIIVHNRIGRPDQSWVDRKQIDVRPPGIGIACVGAGLAVAGSVLYVIQRRKNPRPKSVDTAMLLPSVGSGSAFTLSLSGRF